MIKCVVLSYSWSGWNYSYCFAKEVPILMLPPRFLCTLLSWKLLYECGSLGPIVCQLSLGLVMGCFQYHWLLLSFLLLFHIIIFFRNNCKANLLIQEGSHDPSILVISSIDQIYSMWHKLGVLVSSILLGMCVIGMLSPHLWEMCAISVQVLCYETYTSLCLACVLCLFMSYPQEGRAPRFLYRWYIYL